MSSRFDILDTGITDLKVVVRKPIEDERGYLQRMFCTRELSCCLPDNQIIEQVNHTYTRFRGTIRGMHYQLPPYAETKIVSCLRGELYDVAVDLRHGSPTFLQWHAEILTAENNRSLVVPRGFAHGFQTLTDDVEFLYLLSAAYAPDYEAGLRPDDPAVNIQWPLAPEQVSTRDQSHRLINQDFEGVRI